MKKVFFASAILATMTAGAVASEAPVANLGDVQGKVLVDHGKGFVAVGADALIPGDRVFVGTKSTATVTYGQCAVKLDKPVVYVVSKSAPCAKGAKVGDAGSVMVSPVADLPSGAGAAGAGAGGAGAGGVPMIAPAAFDPAIAVVTVGALAAGGALLLLQPVSKQ